MHNSVRPLIIALSSAALFACSATQVTSNDNYIAKQANVQTVEKPQVISLPANKTPAQLGDTKLTLEQIMADPDWMGRSPESPFWSIDGNAIYYSQKREGSVLNDLWQQDIKTDSQAEPVAPQYLHQADSRNRVSNANKSMWAWIFKNNIYVQKSVDRTVIQLTRSSENKSALQFLNDGRLSFTSGNAIFTIDPATGLTQQLVSWKFADKPRAVEPPKDYIARQQLDLIDVLEKRRNDKIARFEQQQELAKANVTLTPEPFYLTPKYRTSQVSLSPNGKFVVLAEQSDESSRNDTDIMPNYINDDGRIAADPVRSRVADAKSSSETLWLLDIEKGSQTKLSYTSLPGYNEDVLADVKKEVAKSKGETYQTNRLPRDIGLMFDWYWSQSPIQWDSTGDNVAVMLEAWDNKDRWIATVDFKNQTLVSQHRLHDDAWVNYKSNSFGWLNNSPVLYFLSEQSGYAHLYTKALGRPEKALTQGQYEVDQLTLSDDDQYIYYQANVKHPGIYEIYRVDLATGKSEALTDLNGMTEYVLNEQQNALLLTHSKLTQPPELFVKNVNSGDVAKRVTFTVSDAFKNINWVAPEIVPIESSHVEKPIYSRVYLPHDFASGDKRKAVVFSHGAGYLQNSHLGWSGYFREFMFHNMLVEQGYVVLDMDYRASAGYGRDWRTAIYRHMGKPEIEDLADGVKWLVDNANVDRQRIGTYGGSYGGFMTFMAMFTQPDLFQAGAALRPVTDWAHYNTGYTANILNVPDVDPIAYERSSPIYFAEGLQKPLLINAPMVDSNVFFVDTVRLVQRLIELEKDNFETAIFPVESHGFVEPSSWLDEYKRIYKLFEDNL